MLFRQTNVVWAALVAASMVAADCRRASGRPVSVPDFVRYALRNVGGVCVRYAAFVAIGGGFALFVALNGSIVVGDKQHHKAALHLAQLPYCAVYVAAHCALRCRRALGAWTRRDALGVALATSAAAAAVYYGRCAPYTHASVSLMRRCTSEPHAFVLADNRHFTFYLWRRVLDRAGVQVSAAKQGPRGGSVALTAAHSRGSCWRRSLGWRRGACGDCWTDSRCGACCWRARAHWC